jgi:hypothetical protein
MIRKFFKYLLPAAMAGGGSCAPRAMTPPVAPGGDRDPLGVLRRRIASSSRPAVLFVGNSYSFALPRAFEREAAARGFRVRTGHSTHGGWTLAQHAGHEPTLRKIRQSTWDVVVFQEQSQLPARSKAVRAREMHPPLRLLVDEARRAGALPVLYQTWGRRDGNPWTRGDDFFAMTERLRAGYREAATAVGGVVVVPVGDAWEDVVRAGGGDALFDPDGSHPSAEGTALTARVFADFLLGGKTNH